VGTLGRGHAVLADDLRLSAYVDESAHPSAPDRPIELDGFWRTYLDSSGGTVRGDLVPDTHLASLKRQNGVRILYTRDSGFRRFDFIDVRDPFRA
jgi:predicted nucleic acid-binding protein